MRNDREIDAHHYIIDFSYHIFFILLPFSVAFNLLYPSSASMWNMPYPFNHAQNLRCWRLHILHVQNARSYTSSPCRQSFNSLLKPTLRHNHSTAVSREKPQIQTSQSQMPQTDGSLAGRSQSRWRTWTTKYRFIVHGLVGVSFGTLLFCWFCVQTVPITGRWQLNLISRWEAAQMAKLIREEEDQLRPELMELSTGSEHPAMYEANMIFNRLVHASGLDDRGLHFRVLLAPSE